MRFSIAALLLMFVGGSLSAQHSFFIRPRAMMKTNRSFFIGESFLIKDDAKNYASNGYFTFVNDGNHFNNTKLNIGLSVGIQFNKKNSLELVISADGSSIKQSYVYYDQNNPNYPATVNQNGLLWGRDFWRVNLEFNRTYRISDYYKLRSSIGFGAFVLHKRKETKVDGLSNNSFIGNSVRKNINWNSWAGIFQIGLGIDVKSKRRNVPLFSFDVFATLNFKTYTQSVLFDVTIVDQNDGSIHDYTYTLVSRGSGINFQLSRPINIYPWRPNKKPKNTEL